MNDQLDPAARYWAFFGNFEIRLPGQAVADIARPGPCDEAVSYWSGRITNEWPDRATPDAIRDELRGYGAWDSDELADDAENWRRLIWLAAFAVSEDESPDCSEPLTPSHRHDPI